MENNTLHVWLVVSAWNINPDDSIDRRANGELPVTFYTIDPRPSEYDIVVGEMDIEVNIRPPYNAVQQQIAGIQRTIERRADEYFAKKKESTDKIQNLLALANSVQPVSSPSSTFTKSGSFPADDISF